MQYSRSIVFVVSVAVSGSLLLLFALGFFDKTAHLPDAGARPQLVAQDSSGSSSGDPSGGGSGDQTTTTTPPSGDPSQGTELQPAEQDEQSSENAPSLR